MNKREEFNRLKEYIYNRNIELLNIRNNHYLGLDISKDIEEVNNELNVLKLLIEILEYTNTESNETMLEIYNVIKKELKELKGKTK